MCEIQDSAPCVNNPCQNGGVCVNRTTANSTFVCQCPVNVYGRLCEFRITAEICNGSDADRSNCQSWSSLGFCSFNYLYNLVPVPICKRSFFIYNIYFSRLKLLLISSIMFSLLNLIEPNRTESIQTTQLYNRLSKLVWPMQRSFGMRRLAGQLSRMGSNEPLRHSQHDGSESMQKVLWPLSSKRTKTIDSLNSHYYYYYYI
jgi:hypothetical protein